MATVRIGNVYESLDKDTRRWMLTEFDEDERAGKVHLDSLLTERGKKEFLWLMREAIQHHDDAWLANGLDKPGMLRIDLANTEAVSPQRPRGPGWRKSGEQPDSEVMGRSSAEVPTSVIEDLAADEFNRYYSRGVCRRVLESGMGNQVEIYKISTGANLHLTYPVEGVASDEHAREPEFGRAIDADYLLAELRKDPESETGEALPGAPGSGMSVRLPA